MPSQFLFEAHGRSESSAESAIHPARSENANAARKALVSEEDIVCGQLRLFPGTEDVADNILLALDLLTKADAPDEFAGCALVAGALDAELEGGKGSGKVFALHLLHCLVGELDDREHVLVVGFDDLALVAGRQGGDGRAVAL